MTGDDHLQILRGTDARATFDDATFESSWRALHGTCPWSTAFQDTGHVRTWLRHYGDRYEPFAVVTRRPDGSLSALLPLVLADGVLTGLGTHQAEYQGWLSDGSAATTGLLARAIDELFEQTGAHSLRLKYLPPGLDPSGLAGEPRLRDRVQVVPHRRPLMRIDLESIEASLRKKGNKSKWNRLRSEGELRFEQIVDADRFAVELERIAHVYDIRQGAMNDVLPFVEDPRKAAFHVDLLRAGVLHATVTTVGERLVAAHLGVVGTSTVHLAIVAFSPLFARHSPGKLHLLELGKMLAGQGVDTLDLTPGDDPWKDRFATAHDEVHELLVYRTAAARAARNRRDRWAARAKSAAGVVGITPGKARSIANSLRRMRPGTVARRLRRLFPRRIEYRLYRMPRDHFEPATRDPEFRCDDLEALTKFVPTDPWTTRETFLQTALKRLEEGSHIYTVVSDDVLVHWGWLTPTVKSSRFTEVDSDFDYPAGSAALYDFYTIPRARGRGLYQRALRNMLFDLCANKDVAAAYIGVLANNRPSRHVIEKLGFRHCASLFQSRAFGRTRNWREDSETAPT